MADAQEPAKPGAGKKFVGSLLDKMQSAGAVALQGVKNAGSSAVAERCEIAK